MIRFVTVFILLTLLVGGTFLYTANETIATSKIERLYGTDGLDIPKKPKRVAFLTTSSMELWIAAGGADKIVARPSANLLPKEILASLPKTSADLGTANAISVENVLKYNPDLVIGSAMVNIQQQMVEPLKTAGVPMLSLPNYGVEDICNELALYGKLIGNEALAQKEIKRIKDNIENEAKRRENIPRKKVLFVWGTPVSFSMALASSRQGDILRLAGGENIAKDPDTGVKFLPISLEYIVKENPDFIVFATHGDKKKLEIHMKKVLDESSAWKTINAIKEERYAVLPPELFAANPGPRIDEAVVYLSKILYP